MRFPLIWRDEQQTFVFGKVRDKLQAPEMTPEALAQPDPLQNDSAGLRIAENSPFRAHCRRSTCPIKIRFGSTMPLSWINCPIGTLNWMEIRNNVSPGRTVYVSGTFGAGVAVGGAAGGGTTLLSGICSTCPSRIRSGLTIPLSCAMACTVVLKRAAIRLSVSPTCTT